MVERSLKMDLQLYAGTITESKEGSTEPSDFVFFLVVLGMRRLYTLESYWCEVRRN